MVVIGKLKCALGFHALELLGFVAGNFRHTVYRCKRCGVGVQDNSDMMGGRRVMISAEHMTEYIAQHKWRTRTGGAP